MRLTPQLLLSAYAQGIFPMAEGDGIAWYDPHPRAILPLEAFHIPRRLQQTVKRAPYAIRSDTAFRAVMSACAAPTPGREETWISPALIDAYCELHRLGFAHSVEAWRDGELVGGLYGVALRGLFAGESMFSRATDASKLCLVHLVERLRAGGFVLLDVQFLTPHLAQFGARIIGRAAYKRRLAHALAVEARWESADTPIS